MIANVARVDVTLCSGLEEFPEVDLPDKVGGRERFTCGPRLRFYHEPGPMLGSNWESPLQEGRGCCHLVNLK